MARFGDRGSYEIGNVRICTVEENCRESGGPKPVPEDHGGGTIPTIDVKSLHAKIGELTLAHHAPPFAGKLRQTRTMLGRSGRARLLSA
jgi:hypothetical protein